MAIKEYLGSDQDLRIGGVDDYGDAKYVGLRQNVPDGYVYDLQTDLHAMGFTDVGTADGAFGEKTRKAVRQFQRKAKLPISEVVDHVTKNEIRTWLTHGYNKNNPPPSEPLATPATENGITLITPRVPHFSQGDSRWASRILGSSATIQRKGCAITSIAMILKFFGRNVTPGILDQYLDSEDGYAGDSVKWSVAGKCGQTPTTKLTYRRNTDKNALSALLRERVNQNAPTMVRVDYRVDSDIRYNHFVVCVGMTAQGEFVMNDPATRLGDGYADPGDDNIIERTTRKNGYEIVQLDWYDHVS
jgi:peptidoglycan hydrolase-like protein with peptidoglycan-binding domain